MGYQNGPAKITVTHDGQTVVWVVDYDAKTVTAVVAGVALGTFRHHTAAKEALGLVDVPVKARRGK